MSSSFKRLDPSPTVPRTAAISRPLFIVSCAALFLEVALIRWISTEVRVFAFVQNLALIACFLGFGLGCYRSHNRANLPLALAWAAALIVIVTLPFAWWKQFLSSISNLLTLSPDAALWGFELVALSPSTRALFTAAAVLVCALLLFLLVQTMVPFGMLVGQLLDETTDPVKAYSVNLAGSIAGAWLLAALSFFWLPPMFWFAFAFLLVGLVQPKNLKVWFSVAVLFSVVSILLNSGTNSHSIWSPYQKITVTHHGDSNYQIDVNNTGYMSIANLTPEYLRQHTDMARAFPSSSYDSPFHFAPKHERVLIVGAGAGNDAAAALRNGAGHVDAVEIDPAIYSTGKRLHPERPYDSPRVNVILTDARNYLRTSNQKYDLIIFGLLDSHTEFSGYSNMRVDNYVYTKESLHEARMALAPGGTLALKFEVREPWTWIGQRFYSMLEAEFGRKPVVYHAPRIATLFSGTVFLASDSEELYRNATRPELARFIAANPVSFSATSQNAPSATSDDWPYLYHRNHWIPRTYLTVSAILLLITLASLRKSVKFRAPGALQFFLLGAGFMLLETQLVSRLGLYFGTTWMVNSIALTAVLIVLVAANALLSRGFAPNLSRVYIYLIASLALNFVLPYHKLPIGNHAAGILMCSLYALTVFFAGLIFTTVFRETANKSSALGANIVGSVAGGFCQNLSFIFGMKFLLVIAAGFYAASYLARHRVVTEPIAELEEALVTAR
jgi:spermidine synthase